MKEKTLSFTPRSKSTYFVHPSHTKLSSCCLHRLDSDRIFCNNRILPRDATL